MGRVAVVTDSTADFAGFHAADLGITIVPLTVNWGRDVLRDRIDLSTSDFYTRLRTDRELPKTAAPPPGYLRGGLPQSTGDPRRRRFHPHRFEVQRDLGGGFKRGAERQRRPNPCDRLRDG